MRRGFVGAHAFLVQQRMHLRSSDVKQALRSAATGASALASRSGRRARIEQSREESRAPAAPDAQSFEELTRHGAAPGAVRGAGPLHGASETPLRASVEHTTDTKRVEWRICAPNARVCAEQAAPGRCYKVRYASRYVTRYSSRYKDRYKSRYKLRYIPRYVHRRR